MEGTHRPSGRYFLAEGHFSAIDVFEQRSSTGGLWNYTPDLKSDRADADAGPEEPQGTATAFASPMYDRLETNIPHPLMRYADRPFEPACQLFPTRETVKAYLDSYAADVAHLIRFQTQVTGVVLARSGVEGGVRSESWTVSTRDLATRTCRAESYGAVVVASGHYAVPYIPDINGMAAWQAAHPGSVSHSKFYRTPADYAAKVSPPSAPTRTAPGAAAAQR